MLFDKTAKRWLISQFTLASSPSYQCVAVSTGADATGTYARYAFAVPNNLFGDYPHFGVWPPAAYYMMAEAGSNGGVFAALDRTKMLAANPTATWLVIMDPFEEGTCRRISTGSRSRPPWLPASSFRCTPTECTSTG